MVIVKNLTKYTMAPITLYKIAIKITLTAAIFSQATKVNGDGGGQLERTKVLASNANVTPQKPGVR